MALISHVSTTCIKYTIDGVGIFEKINFKYNTVGFVF